MTTTRKFSGRLWLFCAVYAVAVVVGLHVLPGCASKPKQPYVVPQAPAIAEAGEKGSPIRVIFIRKEARDVHP